MLLAERNTRLYPQNKDARIACHWCVLHVNVLRNISKYVVRQQWSYCICHYCFCTVLNVEHAVMFHDNISLKMMPNCGNHCRTTVLHSAKNEALGEP